MGTVHFRECRRSLRTNIETSALPRVQEETAKKMQENYDYIDPARPITRSLSHLINDKQIKVDEIPSLKEQVMTVDRRMDSATKSTATKRKQSIPRVAKKSTATKAKARPTTTEPIARQTR